MNSLKESFQLQGDFSSQEKSVVLSQKDVKKQEDKEKDKGIAKPMKTGSYSQRADFESTCLENQDQKKERQKKGSFTSRLAKPAQTLG